MVHASLDSAKSLLEKVTDSQGLASKRFTQLLSASEKFTKIAKILISSPIHSNVPTKALLAGETKGYFVWWLANLNLKRNLKSMFASKYLTYVKIKADIHGF